MLNEAVCTIKTKIRAMNEVSYHVKQKHRKIITCKDWRTGEQRSGDPSQIPRV